jgi:hypothetical protein
VKEGEVKEKTEEEVAPPSDDEGVAGEEEG